MRQSVKIFISYARAEKARADDIVKRLETVLLPSRRYDYQLWRDSDIVVGERLFEDIDTALETCDAGLLLLSPAFLGSRFIARHEVPRFVGPDAAPVMPVMLKAIDFKRHNLQGIEQHLIFQYRDQKAYCDCPSSAMKDAFVNDLFEQIERRMDRLSLAS